VLQPSKKNQTIHVNKCNKANVNITKDMDPKIIPFHKMCEASDEPKYLYNTKVPRHSNSLPHTSALSTFASASASF
jgi:hypothetical protein